ncbi:hypothetical protein LOTGIDRAFT_233521 [Lottia gigantea]|uniref:Uncharacterized protein n=1 Tax=Lottia gigantea TaxID=225164 RepID=V4A7N1_LOTGI|nr:hypothetical protein LOTGIDRAFT_233521 [Lottia gigantea]ESO91030.1 hypothetical protein LOTGIDRAFT_233521 [Lottia gigantea]
MNLTSQFNITTITSLPGADDETSLFDTEVTTAELVVIGAGITVAILAVGAILLRMIMPLVRESYKKKRMLKDGIKVEKNKNLLAPGTPSSMMSRSSRTSSRNGEWSDSGSDRTKTTFASDSGNYVPRNSSYGNIRPHKIAYPMYLPNPQNNPKTENNPEADKLNDDLISVISSNSLEPANFGEAYRQNWDQTFDPFAHNDESLSYVAHASENRSMPDKQKSSEWYSHEPPMRRDWERSQQEGQVYRHDIQPTKLTRL